MRKISIFLLILGVLLMTACTQPQPTSQPTPYSGTGPNGSTGEGLQPTAPSNTVTTPTTTNKPTDPVPTDPVPTDPVPTDPAPTEPTTPIEPTAPEHFCFFAETESFEGTCTQEGYVVYACDCGSSFKSYIGFAAHTFKVKEQVEGTETETAYTVYECTECGHTEKVPVSEEAPNPPEGETSGQEE